MNNKNLIFRCSKHPIITQGSTVTKITFEGHQPPVSEVAGGSCVPKLALPVTVSHAGIHEESSSRHFENVYGGGSSD